MKSTQKYTPKYWVVHDVTEDGVYLFTASKSMDYSIDLYVESMNAYTEDGLDYSVFDDNADLQCSLIEINLVED